MSPTRVMLLKCRHGLLFGAVAWLTLHCNPWSFASEPAIHPVTDGIATMEELLREKKHPELLLWLSGSKDPELYRRAMDMCPANVALRVYEQMLDLEGIDLT